MARIPRSRWRVATLIPGDGIGPEVVEAARRVIAATGVEVEWIARTWVGGFPGRDPLPPDARLAPRHVASRWRDRSRRQSRSGLRSSNIALRQGLDLYANVRPCGYTRVPRRMGVDLVVVRGHRGDVHLNQFELGTPGAAELIEFIDERTGLPVQADGGISVVEISESGAEGRAVRLPRAGHGRQAVPAAHKANIMKVSDGLFLETARRVAEGYPT